MPGSFVEGPTGSGLVESAEETLVALGRHLRHVSQVESELVESPEEAFVALCRIDKGYTHCAMGKIVLGVST